MAGLNSTLSRARSAKYLQKKTKAVCTSLAELVAMDSVGYVWETKQAMVELTDT